MKDNPCRECVPPERHLGCHTFCEAYIEWKEELEELKVKIRKQKQMDGWNRPENLNKRRY